jgi:hypothetical protein
MRGKLFIIKRLFGILALLWLIQPSLQAQLNEFDIQLFSPDKPELGIIRSFPDKAIIIVYSSIKTLKFESTLGIKENRSDPERGVYKLIVEPQKQIIFIQAVGFRENKIETKKIEEQEFIYYTIEPKQKPLNPDKGNFNLYTAPSGANFEIDGLPIKGTTPYQSEEFLAETFKIRITKGQYESTEIILSIVKGETISKTVRLTPKFGYIRIDCDQSEVELYLNGSLVPYQLNEPLEVHVGQYIINLKKRYYEDFIDTLFVGPNDDPNESIIIVANLIRQKGNILVTTNVKEAQVYLNGVNIGNTPLNKQIDAGQYLLEVKKENYRPETINFEVLKNETTEKSVELKKYGLVKIFGINGTRITLNGNFKGILPNANNFELPPGEYKIEAQLDGYDNKEINFTLESEVKIIELNLIETEGRFFRWCAFGNKRLSQVTPPFYIYLTANINTLNPELLSTAARYPIYEPVKNNFYWGIGLSLTALPITFETELILPIGLGRIDANEVSGSEQLTNYPDSTLFTTLFLNARLGYCPFALFERIYPFIGIMSSSVGIGVIDDYLKDKLKNNNDKYENVWHTDIAIYYGLSIRIGERVIISIGYDKFFNNDAFNHTFYTNIAFGAIPK